MYIMNSSQQTCGSPKKNKNEENKREYLNLEFM